MIEIVQTPAPGPKERRSDRAAIKAGVTVVAVVAGGFALWALRHILAPFALAAFLLLMIDGLARALIRRVPRFPPAAALPAAIVAIVVLFGLTVWAIAANTMVFVGQAGVYTDRLNTLLQRASDRFGLAIPSTVGELVQQVNPRHYAGAVAEALRGVGEGTVFVLIYLGFLIASRGGFEQKARALFGHRDARNEAGAVFDQIRQGVESYIWVQTEVSVILGLGSAVLMALFGLSHVLFWAFIIFLASYIPVIGAAIGVIFPPLFGLVEFNDFWRPVALLVCLEGLHFVVSHVMQPRMQGKSLNVDPVVVLLALAFFGLLWGVTGAFLSTPLTVMLMAIAAEFPSSRWIAVLLSSDGKPAGARAG